jgi:glutaconate CoA-transferase subunit B
VIRQSLRTFVDRLDFITSVGHGTGPGSRQRLGLRGAGPSQVITDFGLLHPDPESHELTLTHLHPGATVGQARAATGWQLAVAGDVQTTGGPTAEELRLLRSLEATKESEI